MARLGVGLDIGSNCVKAVQLRRNGKSTIELEKFGMAEVNPGGPPLNGSASREAKVRAIQAALDMAKIKTRNVVSSVSGEPIIVRYIQLPDMPENELKEALRWEAEEYIPFNIDEVNLDSTILGKSEDGSMVNVLLVAAKRDLIAEHVDTIRAAGLQPEIVDVDSFAFLNCYEINYEPDPSSVVALVNLGSSNTNINIFFNGVSHFSRDIPIAGNQITTMVKNKLGKEWNEAEQMKIMEGAPEVNAEALVDASVGGEENANLLDSIRGTVERLTGENVSDSGPEEITQQVIKSNLDTLLSEVRRSIQFFENQANGRTVQQLVVGGGSARLKNIEANLNAELGLPVELINPFQRIQVRSKDIDLSSLDAMRSHFGVGVGLALRKVVDE